MMIFLHKAFKKGRVFGVKVGCGVYWGLGALGLGIGFGGAGGGGGESPLKATNWDNRGFRV